MAPFRSSRRGRIRSTTASPSPAAKASCTSRARDPVALVGDLHRRRARPGAREHARPLPRERDLPEDHRGERLRGILEPAHVARHRRDQARTSTSRCRRRCAATTCRARATAAATARGRSRRRQTGSTVGTCVLPANPMPEQPILRALTDATIEWVTKDREMPPRLRQRHRARAAVEQLDAERGIELADLGRERRLRRIQRVGCRSPSYQGERWQTNARIVAS